MQRKIDIPTLVISSVVAGIAVIFYSLTLDFRLTEFSKALPGEATFNGIDISKRTSAYFYGLFVFSATFLIAFFSFHKWLTKNKWLQLLSKVVGIIILLSLVVSLAINQNYGFEWITWASLSILISSFFIKPNFWRKPIIHKWKLKIVSLATIINAPIILSLKGIALLVGYFTTEEKIRLQRINTSLINEKVYPLVIFIFAIFIFVTDVYVDQYELFENANPANALMRVFKFGEIPFIHFLSSHLLSEQIPIFLYTLLHGYEPNLDSFKWLNIFMPFGFLSIYYFLKQVLSSGSWAFVVIMVYPFLECVFPLSYWYALVSVFLIYRYFLSPSFKTTLWLVLWSFFLVFWRIDVAAAHIPALGATMFFFLLKGKLKVPELKNWIFSAALVLGIAGLFFYLLNYYYHGLLVDNVKQALSYFGASQTHAYAKIASNYNSIHFVAHHFIFPCVIAIILFSTIFKWNPKGKNHDRQFIILSIIFLSLFYFFNAPRGLVRHGFIEGSDRAISSFLYLIVGLFIILKVNKRKRPWVFIISCALFVIVAKYGSQSNQIPLISKAYANTLNYHFGLDGKALNPKSAFKKAKTDSLVTYLNQELKEGETFFDYSNTPMLYFYAQRKVPSYFNQSLQNETTPFIQQKNLEQIEGLDIPLVVFSHYPDNWWDNTDGVPNAIRYPILAEWIYEKYVPDTVLAGYQIWTQKDLVSPKHKMPEKVFYPRKFDLKYYPAYYKVPEALGNASKEYFPNKETHLIKDIAVFENLNAQLHQYLNIQLFGRGSEMLVEVKFLKSKTEEVLGTYIFRTKAGIRHYSLPLWLQYNWHLKKPDLVSIEIIDGKPKGNNPLYKELIIKEYAATNEH